MQLRDMTWGYSFGKSPRLAREIDLSHPGRFYSSEKRRVPTRYTCNVAIERRTRRERHTRANEMDARVCDATKIRRPNDRNAISIPRTMPGYADIKTWILLSSILCVIYMPFVSQNCIELLSIWYRRISMSGGARDPRVFRFRTSIIETSIREPSRSPSGI